MGMMTPQGWDESLADTPANQVRFGVNPENGIPSNQPGIGQPEQGPTGPQPSVNQGQPSQPQTSTPTAPAAPQGYDLGTYAGRQAYRDNVLHNDPQAILDFNEQFHRGGIDLGTQAGRQMARDAMTAPQALDFNQLFHTGAGQTFGGFGAQPLGPGELVGNAARNNLIQSGPDGSLVGRQIANLSTGTSGAQAALKSLVSSLSTLPGMGNAPSGANLLYPDKPVPAPAVPGASQPLSSGNPSDLLAQFFQMLMGGSGAGTPAASSPAVTGAAPAPGTSWSISPLGPQNRQPVNSLPGQMGTVPSSQFWGSLNPSQQGGVASLFSGLGYSTNDLMNLIQQMAPPGGSGYFLPGSTSHVSPALPAY